MTRKINKERVVTWNENFERDSGWSTDKHQIIKDKEANIINSFFDKYNFNNLKVLELGCGDGYVGNKILKSNSKIKCWIFTDLLGKCISKTKILVKDKRASFYIFDAYAIEKFKTDFNSIVSTGYASVASYENILPLVSKRLNKGDILICDFINHLSFPLLPNIVKTFSKYINGKIYHVGKFGIEKYFKKYNMKLIELKYVQSNVIGPIICLFQKI